MQKRNRMAYAASHAEGQCLINQFTVDDYAKIDEINANKVMERMNQIEDQQNLAKALAKKNKAAAIQMANLISHNEKSKSLLKQYQEKGQPDPKLDNKVYATIKVAEITKGLTPDDFR